MEDCRPTHSKQQLQAIVIKQWHIWIQICSLQPPLSAMPATQHKIRNPLKRVSTLIYRSSQFFGHESSESLSWSWNVSHNAVEFLLGVLVFVSLSWNSNTDLAWNVSDSLSPDVSVKVCLNAHILRTKKMNALFAMTLVSRQLNSQWSDTIDLIKSAQSRCSDLPRCTSRTERIFWCF